MERIRSERRIDAIDATRGTAMLAVFLSHFTQVYFRGDSSLATVAWLYRFARLATPTFMVVSGLILGYLYATHKNAFARTKAKFLVRGLFLLTVARILILIAHLPFTGNIEGALRYGFITDTIGISMILGSLLIERLSIVRRLVLGLLLYVSSAAAWFFWNPGLPAFHLIKDILVGEEYGKGILTEFFPLGQWFGIYMIGTTLGETIGALQLQGNRVLIERLIARLAAGSLISALGISLIFHLSGLWHWILGTGSALLELGSIAHKRPPSPAYLLFYGGMGLMILFLLMRLEGKNRLVMLYARAVRLLGANSLFVFIIQYFMYFTLLQKIDLAYSNLWPFYFLATAAVIFAVSGLWYYKKGNFFSTVESWIIAKTFSKPAATIPK